MNAYVKGAIGAVIAIIAILSWYLTHSDELPVNKTPESFRLISKLEKEGMEDFALQRLDGSTLRLSDLKGRVVVLNFWASWCNPCVQEFPSMVSLVEKMGGDVVVVAVSGDDQQGDIQAFVKAFGLPRPGFEVVWDKDKKVTELYGVSKLPESFIIGRDFKLARKIVGTEDWANDGAVAYFKSLTTAN
jgi:peroxiredoxin